MADLSLPLRPKTQFLNFVLNLIESLIANLIEAVIQNPESSIPVSNIPHKSTNPKIQNSAFHHSIIPLFQHSIIPTQSYGQPNSV
ncbi:MAG: hypothetical protein C5B50_07045 [Verrucomicrobia bacterium]|nr:MAG: hypothetical protein C5B50_07045 [Verrucomicrobiota bacterium]